MTFVPCPRCKTRNSTFNPTCIACGKAMEEPREAEASPKSERVASRVAAGRPGDRVGSYVIEEAIARGTTGAVSRCRRASTDEVFAMKILHPHLLGSAEARSRFLREARALASVSHPNLGGIHEVIDEAPLLALVLELVDGEPLDAMIARGPIAEATARALLADVARGLEALHAAGVVHRDLKPANVVVARGGGAKIIDLGLVRVLESRPGSLKTEGGVLLGSLAYSAPELVLGEPAVRASDAWSLGVVAFEMLTGRRPFEAPSRAALAAAILGEEPRWGSLPAGLSQLVHDLLRKEAAERPRSLGSIAASLAR